MVFEIGHMMFRLYWDNQPVRDYACDMCGKPGQTKHPRRRWCSEACKQRAKYQRQKAGLTWKLWPKGK